MRPMWKGSLGFGLVSIPVRMYAATGNRDPALHYLHKTCLAPVRYHKVCSACGQTLQQDDLVYGYEVEPDRYVALTEEDLASLPLPAAREILVEAFVPAGDVDPIYFEKAHYLEPDGPGARAYRLLQEAMLRAGTVALGRVALRRREHLSLVRPYGRLLLLETLLDPDEIRDPASLTLPPAEPPADKEMQLALTLVETLRARFDPAAYPDRYRQALEQLIAAKVAGRQVHAPEVPESRATLDLVAALQASIQAAKEGKELVPAAHAGQGGGGSL